MTDPIIPRTHPEPEGDGPVISDIRAKGGRGGGHVMVIMVVSVALVAIVFAVIYLVAGPGLQRAETDTEAAATSAEGAQALPDRPTPTLPADPQPRLPDPPTDAQGNPPA